jgi:hypothetical protein
VQADLVREVTLNLRDLLVGRETSDLVCKVLIALKLRANPAIAFASLRTGVMASEKVAILAELPVTATESNPKSIGELGDCESTTSVVDSFSTSCL